LQNICGLINISVNVSFLFLKGQVAPTPTASKDNFPRRVWMLFETFFCKRNITHGKTDSPQWTLTKLINLFFSSPLGTVLN
jgi:hypothetical protein